MPLIFFLLFCSLSAVAGASVKLRVGVNEQSSAPYIMGEGSQLRPLPGLSIEQMQLAVQGCNVALELERLPPLRLLQNLEKNVVQGVLMISYTPERARFAVYPMKGNQPDHAQRLSTLSYVFYINERSRLEWDGQRFNAPLQRVGVNMGWSVIKDLERLNMPFETALSVRNNFSKLQAGRIDAYAIHQNVGEDFLEHNLSFKMKVMQPPISVKDYFLTFSQRFYKENPQISACIWKNIGNQRDALLKKRLPVYLQAEQD